MGRKKLNISKKYLNDFYYGTKYLEYSHGEFLFHAEVKLLDIIAKSNFLKMSNQEFDKFINENIKLIKQCRYIENKKIKYEKAIQEILKKDKDSLNDEELQILALLDFHANITDPEHFYKFLDIYLSTHSQEIKAMQYQNIKTENRVIDAEKQRHRKQQNNEKFFLGGVLNSLSDYLSPSNEKNKSEVLVEMIQIYTILKISNRSNEIIEEFKTNQHLSVLDEISKKLDEIQKDPRNPFLKKANQ